MRAKLIVGLHGVTLTPEEAAWLRRSPPPAGIILFARNAESPEQVRALIDQARSAAGAPLWAAIDEEGGRVHRLSWPPFHPRPDAESFGRRYAVDRQRALMDARDDARRCGEALSAMGFTHNCAPVLDLRHPEGHAVIGSRAYGRDVATVAALGEAVMQGLDEAGVAAVAKHFPGHGRADADSHLTTPEVRLDEATLLAEAAPFRTLIGRGLRHVMTAHVRYPSQDGAVASCSRYWHRQLRRSFGFRGTIWSDDLSMGGAGDDLRAALVAADRAGCDRLLVCQPRDCGAIFRDTIPLDAVKTETGATNRDSNHQ